MKWASRLALIAPFSCIDTMHSSEHRKPIKILHEGSITLAPCPRVDVSDRIPIHRVGTEWYRILLNHGTYQQDSTSWAASAIHTFSLWQSMFGAFVAFGGLGSPGAPEEEAKVPEAPKERAQWLVGVPSFPRTSQSIQTLKTIKDLKVLLIAEISLQLWIWWPSILLTLEVHTTCQFDMSRWPQRLKAATRPVHQWVNSVISHIWTWTATIETYLTSTFDISTYLWHIFDIETYQTHQPRLWSLISGQMKFHFVLPILPISYNFRKATADSQRETQMAFAPRSCR